MSSSTPLMTVGQSVPQLEAAEKLDGSAQYIADMVRPGMLHAALLQSPFAHARIRSYDLTEALALPGVRAIVTGDDVDAQHRMGAFVKDEPGLAKGKVRYMGEIVAAVAADTEAIARQATRFIRVDYEELPAVFDPLKALLPDSPAVHDNAHEYAAVFDTGAQHNTCSRTDLRQGDADAAWSQCAVVVEGVFQTQAQAHLSIEPCGALAEVDASGRITLWSANQSVFRVQASVCETLGLPMSRLRCLTPRIGAGFGNKMEAHVQPVTVLLAMKAKRPVRLIMSREEDFEAVRVRHPAHIRMKTGAAADGSLIAREVELVFDGGAYGDDSPGVLGYALLMNCGPYRIAHVHAHGRVAYTNKLRSGAMRGFGVPQVNFASEQQIDEIAVKLALDPAVLRQRNAMGPQDTWFGGQALTSNGLGECLQAVLEGSQWQAKRASMPAPEGKRRGIGMALAGHISGLLSSGAIVRLLEDGTAILNVGSVDIGQGSNTVLLQMCAESLKLPMDRVAMATQDTDSSPYNWGTTASRITFVTGRSVVEACKEIIEQAKDHASAMLGVPVEQLELRDGGLIGVVGQPGQQVSLAAISGRAHWAVGGPLIGKHSWIFDTPTMDAKRSAAIGLPFPQIGVFCFSALVVEVEVDEATGKTKVMGAWSACDVGKAINPMMVRGQIEGAFIQGMGYALTEELVWDGGRLANPSLMDYKIPTMAEMPAEMTSYIIESNDSAGPFGAKSVGEIGINTVAAAIANAVSHALGGARLRNLPLTSERVLMAQLSSGRGQ